MHGGDCECCQGVSRVAGRYVCQADATVLRGSRAYPSVQRSAKVERHGLDQTRRDVTSGGDARASEQSIEASRDGRFGLGCGSGVRGVYSADGTVASPADSSRILVNRVPNDPRRQGAEREGGRDGQEARGGGEARCCVGWRDLT